MPNPLLQLAPSQLSHLANHEHCSGNRHRATLYPSSCPLRGKSTSLRPPPESHLAKFGRDSDVVNHLNSEFLGGGGLQYL